MKTNDAMERPQYHIGQIVSRRDTRCGIVIEIIPPKSERIAGAGGLVIALDQPGYTGSDERDDAGIVAGTRYATIFVSYAQIAGDPLVQVPTYTISERD